MCKQCGKAKCACKPAKKCSTCKKSHAGSCEKKETAKKSAPAGKKDKDGDKDSKKPAFLKKGKK